MKIIVASGNNAKIQAVYNVFEGEDIDFCIVSSDVSNRPIGIDTIIGAYNRANNVEKEGDYIVALEGGYFVIGDKYYIADICCIKSDKGYQFGNSDLFTLSKNMFDCVNNNISLNAVIKNITNYKETKNSFKQGLGIVGYMSQGKYDRCFGNTQAVMNAYNSEVCTLEDFHPIFNNIIDLHGEQFDRLDEECKHCLDNIQQPDTE